MSEENRPGAGHLFKPALCILDHQLKVLRTDGVGQRDSFCQIARVDQRTAALERSSRCISPFCDATGVTVIPYDEVA